MSKGVGARSTRTKKSACDDSRRRRLIWVLVVMERELVSDKLDKRYAQSSPFRQKGSANRPRATHEFNTPLAVFAAMLELAPCSPNQLIDQVLRLGLETAPCFPESCAYFQESLRAKNGTLIARPEQAPALANPFALVIRCNRRRQRCSCRCCTAPAPFFRRLFSSLQSQSQRISWKRRKHRIAGT